MPANEDKEMNVEKVTTSKSQTNWQDIAQAQHRKKIARRKPIGYYSIKDKIIDLISQQSFIDAILVSIAFLSMFLVMPFYPIYAFIILFIILFAATIYHPFLGLIIFTFILFPLFMYQTPVLAWAFLMVTTLILIFGYMHYRTMLFTYILFSLAFSPMGYIFVIPMFIYSVLTIGNKRAILTITVAVLAIVVFSGVTGIANAGYIIYNTQAAHQYLGIGYNKIITLDSVSNPAPLNINVGINNAIASFTNSNTIALVPDVFSVLILSLLAGGILYIVELILLILIVMLIDWYATSHRSKFKGMFASFFGISFPLFYVLAIGFSGYTSQVPNYVPFFSFLIAPITFFVFEKNDINIVKALEVKKQDIRMKFGEAFEDLSSGTSSETFNSIGDYEQTKEEIKEAVVLPIEEKGVSRAYNVKPAKGILLFGPPGTGKTLLMRALSNEIHAGFYYVRATDLISAYPGESERMINKIFTVAKKNTPCVLFIDEIDTIATSREIEADETRRHALSQFLMEMDGFQKVNKVVIVGATNRPDLLDSAIMRPGRFDKLIYVPLPDANGRKEIFKKYLSDLPISEDIDYDEIATRTDRYSGADIKAVVDTIAQTKATESTLKHKVFEITREDILRVIAQTKPSTTLAQLDMYTKFKLDYERNLHPEIRRKEKDVTIDDVIGLDDVKKAVKEAIEIPLLHPDLMQKYNIKPINGLLMFGPPGNGKTMIMRAIKNEFEDVTMLELSGAEIAEEGLEKANATIKETFSRAQENAPSIIFIDEIDGIFPKREGSSEFMVQITSQLLQEIDGIRKTKNIVIVGATNRPDMLDAAILRPGRFDKLIYVEPPDANARAQLFRKYLAGVPIDTNINFNDIAAVSEGFTGADIANVCREAKTNAMEKEVETGKEAKITENDLIEIIKRTKPSAPMDLLNRYITFINRYGRN
ncbi:MAG: AAA family ATPase [Candidatus Micrarchaeia archaeon]